MAKGQVKKEKSNKPKLSTKEKKKNKAAKKATKAASDLLLPAAISSNPTYPLSSLQGLRPNL